MTSNWPRGGAFHRRDGPRSPEEVKVTGNDNFNYMLTSGSFHTVMLFITSRGMAVLA